LVLRSGHPGSVFIRLLFTGNKLPLTILPMRALASIIVCTLLVAACGYKGPLYLPKPDAKKAAPAPAQPKEEEKK
jgi:predicted small lipoprotein YifL